jgi:hypothetical protein
MVFKKMWNYIISSLFILIYGLQKNVELYYFKFIYSNLWSSKKMWNYIISSLFILIYGL